MYFIGLGDGTIPEIGMRVGLYNTDIPPSYWAYALEEGEITRIDKEAVTVRFDTLDPVRSNGHGACVGFEYDCLKKHLSSLEAPVPILDIPDSSLLDFLNL